MNSEGEALVALLAAFDALGAGCSNSSKAASWGEFVQACDRMAAKSGIDSHLIQKETRRILNQRNVEFNRREGRAGSPSAKAEKVD